jgi:DNA polymerase V
MVMDQLKDSTLGLFGIRENSQELDLSLDERFVPNPTATFFFSMQGSLMEPLIYHGDTLVIDRSLPLTHNKVIVASYQGQFLCRRFFCKNNIKKLTCDHRDQAPLLISDDDFTYFGQVTSLVRENL